MAKGRAIIEQYFLACSEGSAGDIAAWFTEDAVIYDTNVPPFRGAAKIGRQWVRVRERWGGAVWTVTSCVENGDVAAIEWTMTGTDPSSGRSFVFHGSEHYRLMGDQIAEIRQYWTFNPVILDTYLVEHPAAATVSYPVATMDDMTAVDIPRHRWNRFEYESLDPEVFRHTELIDGEIFDVSPMSRRHAFTTTKLTRLLTALAVAGEGVGCQTPVVLSDHSEPEPDVWVSRTEPTSLDDTKPEPADLLLVVEVADSSLVTDRKVKIPVYAAAGVPLVWLAHVGSRTITVYSEPTAEGYGVTSIFHEGQSVSAPMGGEIAVSSVFLK